MIKLLHKITCPTCKDLPEFMNPPIIEYDTHPEAGAYQVCISVPCKCLSEHCFWIYIIENSDGIEIKTQEGECGHPEAFVPTNLSLWPERMEANAMTMKMEHPDDRSS